MHILENRDATERILDEREAAEFLRLSRRTLQNLRWRGGGPLFFCPSRRVVRYRLGALLAWLGQEHANTGRAQESVIK